MIIYQTNSKQSLSITFKEDPFMVILTLKIVCDYFIANPSEIL